MEKLKLISGLGKIEQICSWINEESENQKLVVFCHHREVLALLRKKIKNCVVMSAETKGEERQKIANIFQKDEKVRVFLSTIRVGGTGLNLFAASTAVFVQLDWNPARIMQSRDRILRIGQLAKEVVALFFIAKDTFEEKIMQLIDLKMQNSKSIIDGEDVQESEMLSELFEDMMKKESHKTRR
jgi:SWI/SNF-related matrix-associated actin-dependent regulator 1 of chromatin subfamily A